MVKVVVTGKFCRSLSHLVPEIVEGVCIGRHGCSILMPSLRLPIEHVHSSIARWPTTAAVSTHRITTGPTAIAVQATFPLSTRDPRVSATVLRREGSKH